MRIVSDIFTCHGVVFRRRRLASPSAVGRHLVLADSGRGSAVVGGGEPTGGGVHHQALGGVDLVQKGKTQWNLYSNTCAHYVN